MYLNLEWDVWVYILLDDELAELPKAYLAHKWLIELGLQTTQLSLCSFGKFSKAPVAAYRGARLLHQLEKKQGVGAL